MAESGRIHGPVEAVIPDLDFAVENAAPLPYAASPHMTFKLRITDHTAQPIHTVILRCQLHLDVTRRRYTPEEQRRLADLFGAPGQWPHTLRGMLWTNLSTTVPGFVRETSLDLHAPCTFDFNVSTTKYCAGLEDGELPLTFFFSGTIFYSNGQSELQVAQISWEKEASFRLPVRVWRDMMDLYYPNTAWVCLHRDTFARLNAFKVRRGLTTFEEALEAILP